MIHIRIASLFQLFVVSIHDSSVGWNVLSWELTGLEGLHLGRDAIIVSLGLRLEDITESVVQHQEGVIILLL